MEKGLRDVTVIAEARYSVGLAFYRMRSMELPAL